MTILTLDQIRDGIVEDYFENGMSYGQLEAKYGRSPQTIGRHLKPHVMAGRVRKKVSADRRSIINADPLTIWHKRVAMRMVRWRTIVNHLTPREAAEQLGITRNRLHTMEGGLHNWTLLELSNLAERMGSTVTDLLRDPHEGDYTSPTM